MNSLSESAELFYRRLISVVDDFGRYTAHPSLLRAALYPLKLEKVREANVTEWLAECETVGLVRLYTHSGASLERSGNQSGAGEVRSGGQLKRFLELLDFRQQVRAKDSKFPSPTSDESQVISICSADAQHMRSESEAESKTKTESKTVPVSLPVNLSGERVQGKWMEWMAFRRKRAKSKDYPAMFKEQATWLGQFDEATAFEILSQSIRNGWQGLFEPKGGPKANTPGLLSEGDKILRRKEMEAAEKQLDELNHSYEGHATWSNEDFEKKKTLLKLIAELQDLLGWRVKR